MRDPVYVTSGGGEEVERERLFRQQLAETGRVSENRLVWALNEVRYFTGDSEGRRRLTFNDGHDSRVMAFETWEGLMYRICLVWSVAPGLSLVPLVICRLVEIAIDELERRRCSNGDSHDGRLYAQSLAQLLTGGVPGNQMYSGLTAEYLLPIIGDQAHAEYHARLTAIGLELPLLTPTT